MNSSLIRQIIHENRWLAAICLTVAVVCATIWYATLHQAILISEQQGRWHVKRRQADLRGAEQGQAQYRSNLQGLRELSSSIPFRHEFPRVISEILDLMTLHGTDPGPMQYKPRKTELDGMIAYGMTCAATGSYPDLKRLIGDLERLDGISTLDAISFANPDGADDTVELKLELTVYLREGQP